MLKVSAILLVTAACCRTAPAGGGRTRRRESCPEAFIHSGLPLTRRRVKSEVDSTTRHLPATAALLPSFRKQQRCRAAMQQAKETKEEGNLFSTQELPSDGFSSSFRGAIRAFDTKKRRMEQFAEGELEVGLSQSDVEGLRVETKDGPLLFEGDFTRVQEETSGGEEATGGKDVRKTEEQEQEEQDDPYAWRRGQNQVKVKLMTDQEILARYGRGLPIYGTRRKFDLSPLQGIRYDDKEQE